MIKKILIAAIVILAGGFFYWQNLGAPAGGAGDRIFIVAKGETVKQVATNLRTNNLISSEFYFRYLAWRGKQKILAGEYSLSPKFNAREILKVLSSGQALSQEKTITIVEGWDIKDIGAYLKNGKFISAADFTGLAKRNLGDWKFDFLSDAPAKAGLEGFLFPDTYKIFPDSKADDIIRKTLDNFDKKLTPAMRAEIKRQKKTAYEIVTMASIIEKEVRTAEDMKIVSGLFWNRIGYGMPLQSDASLSYILEDKIGAHTFEDLKIDSPYNTYKYRGLPPGPISNPGFKAIEAAIYPAPTEYNYFLSDPATGKTVFSKSLEEHNRNKAKYLK